jgi:hypothetical protein
VNRDGKLSKAAGLFDEPSPRAGARGRALLCVPLLLLQRSCRLRVVRPLFKSRTFIA